MSGFVPLRVRSHGSLLLGTASPEALVGRALESGCDALALTDRDNLYLAIRFLQHARAHGLRPLTGAELTSSAGAVLLLALDRRGYANLCRLLTLRHLEPRFDLISGLAELHHGLHVIVESAGLAGTLIAAGVPVAQAAASGVPPRGRPAPHAGGLWMGVRALPSERAGLAERAAAA